MKSLSTNPRVFLCTANRRFRGDYIDALGWTGRRFSNTSAPLRVSPGLRFIKQNVPEVQILEYPLWHEYVEKLKQGWDVVGFSFYHNQIGEIREMIAEARLQGVKEIWAGNYGVLAYYHKMGINDIVVLDELFGAHPKLADKVTRLFARYRFRWWAQSRAVLFLRYLDPWYERGLRLPSVGVESM